MEEKTQLLLIIKMLMDEINTNEVVLSPKTLEFVTQYFKRKTV